MNLFELAAVLTLNKSSYDKGIKDAEKSANSMGSKVGAGLKAAGAMATKVVAVGATAIGALVKQSVSAYGQYEQLLGGAQLMFGDAYEKVAEKAKNAYKTVQLSQSQYLEQVSGFAVGLKNALGGDAEAAADLADRIVQAEADVVASQGITQEAVQNAFNGIMRNNFTMLDNLRLGINPTKEGMKDLIDTVNQWNATQGRSTDYQMGNLADMQSALVDYIEMQGLAGYASMEAGDTITGSLSSVKAAWDNLIVGIGDKNADIGQLVSNVMSQATGAVKNMLPIIKNALSGIGPMIEQLTPAAVELAVGLITDNLPDLIAATVTVIKSIGTALSENTDAVVDAVFEVLDVIVDSLTDPNGLLSIIDAGLEIVIKLAEGLSENLPTLLPAITGIILDIVDKLTDPENLGTLIDAAISILLALADGLISSIDKLLDKAPEIISNLVTAICEAAPKLLDAAAEIMKKIGDGIAEKWEDLKAKGREVIDKIKDGLYEKLEDAKNWGKNLIDGFVSGILEKWENLKAKVTGIVDKVKGIFTGKQGLDEHSPSRWGKKVFEQLLEGQEEGIEAKEPSLLNTTKRLVDNVKDTFDADYGSGSYPVSTYSSGSSEGSIYALLQQYLPMLAQLKVYLDTGVLVGELTPGVDAALGQRKAYALRGNA